MKEFCFRFAVLPCDNNEEGKVIYFGTPGRWRHPTAKFGY